MQPQYQSVPPQDNSKLGLWIGLGVLAVLLWTYRKEIADYLSPKVVIQTGPAQPAPVLDKDGSVAGVIPVAPAKEVPVSQVNQTVTPAPVSAQKPAPAPMPVYKPVGCFADSEPRAMPTYGGDISLDACAQAAKAAGFKVFGIQYSYGAGLGTTGGQCWYGDDKGYNRLGTSGSCINDAAGNPFGQAWANGVYQWQ